MPTFFFALAVHSRPRVPFGNRAGGPDGRWMMEKRKRLLLACLPVVRARERRDRALLIDISKCRTVVRGGCDMVHFSWARHLLKHLS